MARTPEDLDLRGCSFAGRSLAGASLRGADVRGADFHGADLRDADLREIRTGMRPAWAALMTALALAVSIAAGAASGYAGRLLQRAMTSPVPQVRALGILVAISLVLLLVVAAVRGLWRAMTRVLPVITALSVAGALIVASTGVGTGRALWTTAAFFLCVAVILVLAVLARLVAGGVGALFFFAVAISGALVGAALGGGLTATAIAIGALVAGQRALRGSPGYPWIERVASALAARGATSFAGADLRGVHLERAHLHASDFRGARLEDAHLRDATIRLCAFDEGPPGVPRTKKKHHHHHRRTPRARQPAG